MSMTQRDALAAAVGSGLLTISAQADEKPADMPRRDPVLSFVPDAARKVALDGWYPPPVRFARVPDGRPERQVVSTG
jgi:hypothetical protein